MVDVDVDAILEALKAAVEAIEVDGVPTPEVVVDEPMHLSPATVVLVLTTIERTAETVPDSQIGSYDWLLTVEAQIFMEATARSTTAQVHARRYAEALIRALDTTCDLDEVLDDDPRVVQAERIGLTEDTNKRVFETWTAQIRLPALLAY